MGNYSRKTGADGFERVTLQTPSIALTVVPEAGGKITQIIDKRANYEWLWRNPALGLKNASTDACYAQELDSGGWDEMLFSIDPCELPLSDGKQVRIPDHGDLVGRAWSLDELRAEPNGDLVCALSADGQTLAYRFRRQINLCPSADTILLHYELRNADTCSWPFYWCAHALFNANPALRLSIAGNPAIRPDESKQNFVAAGNWPRLGIDDLQTVELALPFAGRAFARKVFVRSPKDGCVQLQHDNAKLSMQYEAAEFPWLGLWLNNQAWNGVGSEPYCNLGIEPVTAATDQLLDVINEPFTTWIEPGDVKSWSIRLAFAQ